MLEGGSDRPDKSRDDARSYPAEPPRVQVNDRQPDFSGSGEVRLTPLREAQLIAAHRDGDPTALAELLRGYQRRVYAVCARMIRDEHEARDLTQDTLVRIIERLDTYDGRAALSTWIIRIAMNLCFSHLRKRKLRSHQSLDHPSPGGLEQGEAPPMIARLPDPREHAADRRITQQETRQRLLEAMNRLDPEVRAILILRDLQDLDYQQVAEVLEIPIGTVKSRLFRAREALRSRLEALDPPDAGEYRMAPDHPRPA